MNHPLPDIRRFCVIGTALCCGAILTACGENFEKEPYERVGLVGETLNAVADSDYIGAAKVLQDIRKEESDNLFLAETERRMYANAALKSTDELIQQGRLQEALAMLRQEVRTRGSTPVLTKAVRSLEDLIMVKALADEAKRASASEAMKAITKRIAKVREERRDLAEMLLPLLQQSLIKQRQLESDEVSKARLDMMIDLDEALISERRFAPQMLSEFKLRAPHLHIEKNYEPTHLQSVLTP